MNREKLSELRDKIAKERIEIQKEIDTKLKPCPKCGGEVKLYSVCKMDINYNCFAKCQKCKEKYILPYIDFKLSGVTIHKDSIKEAEKAWNNFIK